MPYLNGGLRGAGLEVIRRGPFSERVRTRLSLDAVGYRIVRPPACGSSPSRPTPREPFDGAHVLRHVNPGGGSVRDGILRELQHTAGQVVRHRRSPFLSPAGLPLPRRSPRRQLTLVCRILFQLAQLGEHRPQLGRQPCPRIRRRLLQARRQHACERSQHRRRTVQAHGGQVRVNGWYQAFFLHSEADSGLAAGLARSVPKKRERLTALRDDHEEALIQIHPVSVEEPE
jgi:hypothetical protein